MEEDEQEDSELDEENPEYDPEDGSTEEPDDEEITQEEEVTETWTDVLPLREVMVQTYDEIDNLSLFQSYVEQLLQGESGFDSSMQLWSEPEGEKLSGVSRKAYELLRKQLEEIANGSETNTTINLSVQEVGIYGGWSLEDLELENFDDEEAIIDALAEKLWMELDYNAVLTSLRVDLSMAMYWFDPTVGVSIHLQGGIRTTGDGQDALILGVKVRFAVEETFQGEDGGYTTDPSWVLNAEAALAKLNGYTLNQVNLANASGTANGEEGIAPISEEDMISTQAETWGAVKAIPVERNYKSTTETVAFQGGYISKDRVPKVDDAEFLAAYVETSGVRYPIIFLGTNSAGEVRYLIDTETNKEAVLNGVLIETNRLKNIDKIIFSYRSTRTKYSVTYEHNNWSHLELENWSFSGPILKSIERGQVGYIYYCRAPGKSLVMRAKNAEIKMVSEVYVATNGGSFIQIYRVSNVIGDVTIEIEEKWKQTSYDISFTMQSADYTLGADMAGSLKVERISDNKSIGDAYLSKEQGVQDTKSRTVLTMKTVLERTYDGEYLRAYYEGIHNTIYEERTGYYQILSRIVIDGEDIPVAQGSKMLQNGEAYGTFINVNVEMWEQMSSLKTVEVPVYSIQLEDVHTDLSIHLIYESIGMNQFMFYKISSLEGVEAQIYTKQEEKIGWETLKIGSYYYMNNAVIPGGSTSKSHYTIRWRNKPGYINPDLIIWVKSTPFGQGRSYTYYTGASPQHDWMENQRFVSLGTDGFYTVELNDIKLEKGEVAYISFDATELRYESAFYMLGEDAVMYDEQGGTIYSSYLQTIKQDLLPIKLSYPVWDEKHIFKGYKIENDMSGHLYQPGEMIDVSKLRLNTGANMNRGVYAITLVAQWEEIDPKDSVLADITIKLRKSDGDYEKRTQTIATSLNAKYEVLETDDILCTEEGIPLEYDKDGSTTTGIEGESIPVLFYEHPATVYYTAGINVASNEVQGQIPTARNRYSFERIDLSTNRLTRQGYTHIGWVDVSTGTQYLFNGTATQSLDENAGIALLTDIQATSEWLSSTQGIVENRIATQVDMEFVVPWDGATLAAVWTEGEDALEAKDITITTEQVAKLTNEWLIQEAGARVYNTKTLATLRLPTVTENTVQTTSGVYSVTFADATSGLTKTISVTVKAVATTTIDQFGTNPFGQTILFVATKPGESVQSALKSAGVTLGVDVQGTGKNFVIIGPNNSGFLISGATGVGYILANKEGTGYTLPGAGSNFAIIGNHEAGYQLIDPNGQVYDVIGDIDQGYYLLSQDKKLYILRGNSVTGFYLVLLSDIDTENDAEDATKQSPLTTGRTRSVYPFGVAGGLLLSLYCVMQWNLPRKKKRI